MEGAPGWPTAAVAIVVLILLAAAAIAWAFPPVRAPSAKLAARRVPRAAPTAPAPPVRAARPIDRSAAAGFGHPINSVELHGPAPTVSAAQRRSVDAHLAVKPRANTTRQRVTRQTYLHRPAGARSGIGDAHQLGGMDSRNAIHYRREAPAVDMTYF